MTTDPQHALEQIDRALEKWKEARSRATNDYCKGLPSDEISELLTLLAATIERVAPPGSRYRENAQAALDEHGPGSAYSLATFPGILKALRADYEAGYLQGVHELIHADLFADFLEMADHLLEEGYKDPAAVIAGGVLEEHLRKLCDKNGIATTSGGRPKKADAMNAGLAGGNVYSKLDQKSVTAWLDLRNKAAHGQYGDYMKDQVALMVQGIRDFISRHPA